MRLIVPVFNIAWLSIILTVQGQDSTSDQKLLTVASNMRHPPFSSWDKTNQAVGVEIDIVTEAAKQLDYDVRFVEREFGQLIELVADGKIDVAVSTIGRTEEREAKIAFSDPYFSTEIVALVRPDSEIRSLSSLVKGKIGADRSTTSFVAAKKNFPQAKYVTAPESNSSWPEMVKNGEIDAFVVDASDQDRLEAESGVRLRRLDQSLAKESFCIAVSRNRPKLLQAINREVARLSPTVPYRIGHVYQLTTPRGIKLHSIRNPPVKLVNDYFKAKKDSLQKPQDADAIIWFGRRAGYLARMNEAIEIFSDGIRKFPQDPRFYRHRGHRYISVRQFDRAIADLEQAVTLIENGTDEIEPDGAPNPQGIPLTTTHGNIWYHLGLAYYLKNDLDNALRCYNQRIELEKYDDNVVANAHWKYMILRRLGRDDDAKQVVKSVSDKMEIIENMSYHRMCLFYNEGLKRSQLQVSTDGDSGSDVMLYGVGNWYLYDQQQPHQAKTMFERLFKNGSPYSFAYIAAEADYVRLFAADH